MVLFILYGPQLDLFQVENELRLLRSRVLAHRVLTTYYSTEVRLSKPAGFDILILKGVKLKISKSLTLVFPGRLYVVWIQYYRLKRNLISPTCFSDKISSQNNFHQFIAGADDILSTLKNMMFIESPNVALQISHQEKLTCFICFTR